MADDNQTTTDQPAVEPEPAAEPKAEEPAPEPASAPAETPAPAESPTSPTEGPAPTSGTSQQLYDIKCSECGKDAQVPFEPSGDRPVYCRECYTQKRNAGR